MTSESPEALESLVGQIADEFTRRHHRGEGPRVEEYTDRYPQVAALLREILPTIQALGPARGGAAETPPAARPRDARRRGGRPGGGSRWLRGARGGRAGRHGRGLQGPRPEPRPRRRPEGAPQRRGRRPGPVPRRGAGGRPAAAPEYRATLRGPGSGRAAAPRPRVRRRGNPRRAGSGRAAAAPPGDSARPDARPGDRRRPRPRAGPPRPEAEQRAPRRGRRHRRLVFSPRSRSAPGHLGPEDHGLRTGEAAGRGRRPDADRGHRRHPELHGSRTGGGRRSRRTGRRHLRAAAPSCTNSSPGGRRSRARRPWKRWSMVRHADPTPPTQLQPGCPRTWRRSA